MQLTLEFGGGLELLCDSVKIHNINVDAQDGEDQITMKDLLAWVRTNLIKERLEDADVTVTRSCLVSWYIKAPADGESEIDLGPCLHFMLLFQYGSSCICSMVPRIKTGQHKRVISGNVLSTSKACPQEIGTPLTFSDETQPPDDTQTVVEEM
ncbi:hypothetical protein LOK49_LG03G03878 [Camellia lanceoleosa]|uniref:Uncharacterized protein n=1 Tax=Camellia lanceoleosa TaxID=1840588 RepID=A0ACC0IFU5_9ERIC|nr:hypothetical protein LOK49_LG03G03878 [Camellia lanceoleosa]